MSKEWQFCIRFGVVLATLAFLHALSMVLIIPSIGWDYPLWTLLAQPAGAFVVGALGQRLVGWSLGD
jgi:hypothetical protein